PDDRRVERAARRRSAQPDPRAARRREIGEAGAGLHGRALRRLRALPAAIQGDHHPPVGRSVHLPHRRLLVPLALPAKPAGTRATAFRGRALARREAPRMIVFWLIAVVFAAGALAYVLRPLLRRAGGQEVKRSDANVAIYKDQLRELDAELAAGTLTPEDHSRARLELEARLLEDVPAVEVERASAGGRRAALVVGIAVPILAV